MQIQIALDRMPADAALACARSVAPLVDWIEVGTSLVKQYGAGFIREVVDAAGDTPVLADLKTADDARWEFTMAYNAGARSATVLGLAPAPTIDTAIAVAAERGLEVVIDLMGLDERRREDLARRTPASVVLAAHVGKDSQGTDAGPLAQLGAWAEGRRVALAGGLGATDLPGLTADDVRVIIGSAVTGSDDPLAAVGALLEAAGRPVPNVGMR
ncbi:MAG: orotidine 5'-phosphate decarboxylase [Propionibacterium sp.]|nr:orotidine 5'-phosphate decarboxylase [Propionibacterium sp.]